MIPLYRYSAETAKHDVELDTWRESKKEHIRCRHFLDEQIAKRFDGMTLPSDCVENTVNHFISRYNRDHYRRCRERL